MQRTQKSFTIGALAVGIVMVFGALCAMAPVGAQVAQQLQPGAQQSCGGNRLGLTPEQKEQARTIFHNARKEARGVFTPAQRTQLKAGMRQERATIRKDVENALGLNRQQRAQINNIREDARTKANAVKADANLPEATRDAQLRDIHMAARAQMKNVLTPAQQKEVRGVIHREIRAQKPFRTVMHSLKLTGAQKAQLKGIREQSHKAFRAILTPQQLQKLGNGHHMHHILWRYRVFCG